jgi:putative membrane-bound dehydrogenase-like protein
MLFLCCALLATPTIVDDNSRLGLRLPDGFEVTEFAGPSLANDIFSLTIDPHGRIVASGRGYIRILVDDDQDGRADRAVEFADGPSEGAQGMLWEGTSLFVSGDGGLRRYRDENGDDRADGPSELIQPMKTGGEHDAHDIKRGPDGWLYLLCGNMTGINSRFAADTSPIREPVAGCIIRFAPDFTASEIVADGFRNAYRMDFSEDGELFTYDSDNERCVSLPWYEPTRFYHVIAGGHYGWLAPQRGQFWRLPPYLIDVVPPVAYLGRGSPTGVVCYRHNQFPTEYRSGFFLADWTFGRVNFVPIARSGSTYAGRPQVFLEAIGENGFAPTDMVVQPATGDLFISIGGRGTRGAVYRIRYPAGLSQRDSAGRSVHMPAPVPINRASQQATQGDAATRLRALQTIQRDASQFSSEHLHDVIVANWNNSDRSIRLAASQLIDRLEVNEHAALEPLAKHPFSMAALALGCVRSHPGLSVKKAYDVLHSTANHSARLDAARVLQLVAGDLASPASAGTIWEGYTSRTELPRPTGHQTRADEDFGSTALKAAANNFPSSDADLDRELARVLAMLEDDDPETMDRVSQQLTDDSSPVDDIHYLAVLARLGAERTRAVTERSVRALLALDRKCEERQLNRDRNWPLRVAELYAELARKDPALNEHLVADRDFGRPDHVIFAQGERFDRQRAALAFLKRSKTDTEFAWNARLIELIGELPAAESVGVLRGLWENVALRDSIVSVLARTPQVEDRAKFIAELESAQLDTVVHSLHALEQLPAAEDAHELLALIRTFRRLIGDKPAARLRERIGQLLRSRTGEKIDPTDATAWSDWFEKAYPDLAVRLAGTNAVDGEAWRKRLEAIDWSIGVSERGHKIFSRAACLSCHSGARAIGPDLRGATSRFSLGDLFTAILQPSRDVSPRYQTTLVATADGKVFQGMIIYEAVDSLILQTGTDTTVRIAASQITERRLTPNSIMPAGLLDELSDGEIADLLAYLKTLR